MKFPSLYYLYSKAKYSFLRFPLTIVCAFIATILGVYTIENNKHIDNFFPFLNVILSCAIGISTNFSVSILGLKKQYSKQWKIIATVLLTLLLFVIYLSLPHEDSTYNTAEPYIRFGMYAVVGHLLVSFAPYLFSNQINGFWNYNKSLFLRLLTSILYSGALFIGVILAILSLKLLFDWQIKDTLFLDVFIVVAGVFNTWFFVGDIPEDFEKLNTEISYPKGLKVFAQYILLPLLCLYLLILYAYGTKILSNWDWPRGVVSYLIICVAILGILTFLLMYPYGKQGGSQWVSKATKWFYIIFLPLIVLLFIAILMRIEDYGITIKRYLVIVLGIWLLVVICHAQFRKSNIQFIPVSLAVTMLLISCGPWGLFSMSEHYQVKRLEKILSETQILKNGKIQHEYNWDNNIDDVNTYKNSALISDSLHEEVKSILIYLDDFHGFKAIQKWFKTDMSSIVNVNSKIQTSKKRGLDEPELYMKTMGIEYGSRLDNEENETYYNSIVTNKLTAVTGYDFVTPFANYEMGELERTLSVFEIDKKSYKVMLNGKAPFELVLHADKEMIPFYFSNEKRLLKDKVNQLGVTYGTNHNQDVPLDQMLLTATSTSISVTISIQSIGITKIDGRQVIKSINGNLLIKKCAIKSFAEQ